MNSPDTPSTLASSTLNISIISFFVVSEMAIIRECSNNNFFIIAGCFYPV
jgi:hypothetical protein